MINCMKCNRDLANEDCLAAMSGSIMGDEYTDCYYLCPACRSFTVAHWRDNFTGTETMHASGPLEESEGMKMVELIRECSEPWDKKCRCAAHLAYFGDSLD